ncbi:MAG: RluA family pseudouridine synthase, partial [Gemmatimonadaceae bacterium]
MNGGHQKASYRPIAGDRIVIEEPPETVREITPEDIPVEVVFEDEYLLVVDKPAGMVVHPAPGNWSGTLVNALMGRGGALSPGNSPDRAGIVHRLDKETSGLLIVAKTARAHRILSAALAARRIKRRYAAMIWGHLDEDLLTVDKPLARDPRDRKR